MYRMRLLLAIAPLALAPALLLAQPTCYRCEKEENQPTQQGWMCSEGPEWCHRHIDDQTGSELYEPQGESFNVWYDNECHNLCGVFLQMLELAVATERALAAGAGIEQVLAFQTSDVKLTLDGAVIRLSSSCGSMYVPIRATQLVRFEAGLPGRSA